MNEVWNFHNYIAVPLEMYGRKYIGETFLSADEIETGEFVNTMLLILSVTYGDLKKVSDFVEQCKVYSDLNGSDIPVDISKTLFSDFQELMKCYENKGEA